MKSIFRSYRQQNNANDAVRTSPYPKMPAINNRTQSNLATKFHMRFHCAFIFIINPHYKLLGCQVRTDCKDKRDGAIS
jgi:hypothetical protein